MAASPELSVFIITKDEEERIGAAIESVRSVATDIVVVDSGSTDRTCEIAESLGARVVTNEWSGYGLQKRFGEDQCRNDWLLNIDADERLSPDLIAEIKDLELGKEADGYRLLIRERYAFETEPEPWAYTYDPVRLYNRNSGRYSDHYVHDRVDMAPDARITELKGTVYHDSILSLTHLIEKMNRYSSFQARSLREEGRNPSGFRLFFEFPIGFLKVYFGRRYFRYGRWGFILAVIYAFGRFARLAKRHELDLMDNAESRSSVQATADTKHPDRREPLV